jgi:hypothetical protein
MCLLITGDRYTAILVWSHVAIPRLVPSKLDLKLGDVRQFASETYYLQRSTSLAYHAAIECHIGGLVRIEHRIRHDQRLSCNLQCRAHCM